MKKLLFNLFLLSTLLFSCSDDDDNSSITPSNVNATVTSGSWRVTYYWDNDHEETSNFAGYSFVFNANGTVVATKAATTVDGSWSTLNDDNKVKLNLVFPSPADFVEISDDWHTVERTDTKIRLQDVSGGSGEIDYLTFEKN